MALPTIPQKFYAVVNKHLTNLSLPAIDPADYNVQAPETYTGTAYPRNTRLILDAPLESTVVGRTTIYYNRIDMGTALTGLMVAKGSATTLVELLPALSDIIGVQLSANDVTPVNLPASGSFTLTASATNLLYSGSTSITLTA